MTVVAFDGKTLASDSQLSDPTGNWASVKKIARVKGWLIGGAGPLDLMQVFLRKFDPDNVIEDRIVPVIGSAQAKDTMEGIIVSPKGVVYYQESSGVITKIKTKGYIAIGCGSAAAMAAMAAGATAVEAVKITCVYDKSCGGKVQRLNL